MLSVEVLRQLLKQIAEQREHQASRLTSGGPATLEAYREAVGYLRALDHVMLWANEISEKLHGKDGS